MELTIDQVKEVAEKQPEFKKGLISSFSNDFISQPPENVVIRTKDEDQKYLDSHVSAVVEERVNKQLQSKVDEQFGQALNKIDAEILSLTGIEKKPNEKTTAYVKRVTEEKRGGDPVTKERLKQLEEESAATKQKYEKELGEERKKFEKREIEFQVDSGLTPKSFPIPAHLKTDEEKQKFIDGQRRLLKNDFLSSVTYKRDDQDNIVYYEGDKPLLDPKDGKPLTADKIIDQKYAAWFVPTAHVQTGTGTGSGGAQGASLPSGGFKDKESIHNYLAANGIEAGSKKYMDELQRIADESKIKI
jgi:hypothetical protein